MHATDTSIETIESVGNRPRLYSTAEAARILSLSQQTVIHAIDRGLLPGLHLPDSRFRRVPAPALREAMERWGIPGTVPMDWRILVLARERETVREPLRALMERALDATTVLLTDRPSDAFRLVRNEAVHDFFAERDIRGTPWSALLQKTLFRRHRVGCTWSVDLVSLVQDVRKHVLTTDDLLEEGEPIPRYLLRRPDSGGDGHNAGRVAARDEETRNALAGNYESGGVHERVTSETVRVP